MQPINHILPKSYTLAIFCDLNGKTMLNLRFITLQPQVPKKMAKITQFVANYVVILTI